MSIGSISFKNAERRTKQQFKKDADINNIMNKYRKTGVLTDPITQRQMFFGDFANIPDFVEVKQLVQSVNNSFDALPSEVRAKFKNDPTEAFKFLEDPKNKEEAIKLGLIPAPKVEMELVNEKSPILPPKEEAKK